MQLRLRPQSLTLHLAKLGGATYQVRQHNRVCDAGAQMGGLYFVAFCDNSKESDSQAA